MGVPIVTGLLRLYQQCTNRQKESKTVKRQSKLQKWPLVYQSSHVYQYCTNSVPTVYQSSKTVKTVKNSQKTVKTAKMTIGVPIVTCLPILYQQCTNRQKKSKDSQTADKWPLVYQSSQVYQDCTNSVPTVKNSQKTVKQQINDHWCTNRHMSTNTVPTVYQPSKTVKRQSNSRYMTIGAPIVKNSKNSQNSQNDHCCTNRHRSTNTVPTVYQPSKTVKRQSNSR